MTTSAAERRAWRILLTSFIAFLLLCGGTLYVAQWFVFQSSVELNVTVSAARGTVRVTLPNTQDPVAITDERANLDIGSDIQTDATSQAVLSFSDPGSGLPLAYLFVTRDSQVSLVQAQAPRFDLNRMPFEIQIRGLSGRSLMVILKHDGRPVQFDITSPQGVVHTTEPGEYAFEISSSWTKVTVEGGEADLITKTDDSSFHLGSNQHAYLMLGEQANRHPIIDKSVVTNSRFSAVYSAGWKAYSDGKPVGAVYNENFRGQPVVTIDRSQANWPSLILDHGETGLVQIINADVSTFSSLELQATFYVDEQSLSTCGIAGSECPLMIRVVYTDPQGIDRIYIHGFYAFHDPAAGYPLLCDTCRAEHERIRLQSWYIYSDNMIAVLPPEQRPMFIRQISFYASGHAYKAYVAQMDLIGSKEPSPGASQP